MPAARSVYPDFQPDPQLLTRFVAAGGSIEREQFEAKLHARVQLTTLREQTQQDRAELAKASKWLAEHVDQPVPNDIDPDWLARAADEARGKARVTARSEERRVGKECRL